MRSIYCGSLSARCWLWLRQFGQPNRGPKQDALLESFFREYLEVAFRLEPMLATRLGDHRFDDQLDDLRAAARQARLDHNRETLAELRRRIDYKALSRNGQIDYEIFSHHLESTIWLTETFHPFEDDPRVYGEYLTESVYLLLTQSSLPEAINVKHASARMGQIPPVVDVARTTLKNPARVKVETAIRQTEGAIGFYESGVFNLVSNEPDRSAFKGKTQPIISRCGSTLIFSRKTCCRGQAMTGGSDRSFRAEARARAECGADRGRGALRSRARGKPGRDRDGGDRAAALADRFSRENRAAR